MKLQISGPVEILTDPLKDSERGVVKVLLELPKSHSCGHNEGTISRKGTLSITLVYCNFVIRWCTGFGSI